MRGARASQCCKMPACLSLTTSASSLAAKRLSDLATGAPPGSGFDACMGACDNDNSHQIVTLDMV